ncbi:MAG TPA: hypothetical protein VGB59_00360 [Allosphingosinicella sp.]|jgi:hypothetical protein
MTRSPDSAPAPIPVICDRCRSEGLSGDDPFEAFGALLDFDPVPRRTSRADGWTEEVQRAFIAALSLTGSARQAARAVGKAQFGVDQLLNCPGSEGFRAAHEEAMAIAGDERSRRLREGLRSVAAEQSGWRPADPPWAKAASRSAPLLAPPAASGPEELSEAEQAEVERLRRELLGVFLHKYALKLQSERRCRVEGRIAEADFYIRQVTMLEVALDVVSGDGMMLLKEVRLQGFDLLAIAETEMSLHLDQTRRAHWEACGDPPRPEYPPRHLLVERDGFATEPLDAPRSAIPDTKEEARRRREEQYARDAEAQVEWEAEARRDYERRRNSDAAS